MITDAQILDVDGYVGNFETKVKSKGRVRSIKHGVAIIAVGAQELKPTEYLYGKSARVMTQLELEEKLGQGGESLAATGSLVMIQCVGCRQEDRNYCSRVCCSGAMKNALKLKALKPQTDIYVLFRDMRTYGFREDLYREASNQDVRFIRYEPEDKPVVEAVEEGGRSYLRVTAADPILGKRLVLEVDNVVLSAAVIPPAGAQDIARFFKVPLGPDGFFQEAHVKLRPVDFAAEGVYLCGTAQYPEAFFGNHQPGPWCRRAGADDPGAGHGRRFGFGVRGGRHRLRLLWRLHHLRAATTPSNSRIRRAAGRPWSIRCCARATGCAMPNVLRAPSV